MFLFIFESIGTSELLMIGIIALIFLGPRKLPQIARTIGKTMADFRSTTNEFKSTWEREVNFEEETMPLTLDPAEENSIAATTPIPTAPPTTVAAPAIRQVDKETFEKMKTESDPASEPKPADDSVSDKRNWL